VGSDSFEAFWGGVVGMSGRKHPRLWSCFDRCGREFGQRDYSTTNISSSRISGVQSP
jgi:hypothetical protein